MIAGLLTMWKPPGNGGTRKRNSDVLWHGNNTVTINLTADMNAVVLDVLKLARKDWCDYAAALIEHLQTENDRLRAELAQNREKHDANRSGQARW